MSAEAPKKFYISGMPVRFIEPFHDFFQKIVNSSVPLFLAALAAIIWANYSAETYHAVWHADISFTVGPLIVSKTAAHWIDEALMTLFFFMVGLEIKRELLVGELASFKRALLPIMAAVGGMVFPALIYLCFNYGTETARGWGIPMATDIAFALAVLAILGKRLPPGLRIFLSALAIADDLGGVLVIALFYTQTISWYYLFITGLFLVGLALANFFWIRWTLLYAVLGIGMWLAILGSGVHATVAGILVAMFIPARGKYDTDTFINIVKANMNRFNCGPEGCGQSIMLNKDHLESVLAIELACHDVETPLQRLEHSLDSWIAAMVLPLFALANAGLVLHDVRIVEAIAHPVTLGVMGGLVFGKPVGILLFTFLAVKFFNIKLPTGANWRHITGISLLGGIGFTMSLFISGLSFNAAQFVEFAKLGIIATSLICGFGGLLVLSLGNKPKIS